MSSTDIPTQLLEALPIPVAVAVNNEHDLNHQVVFMNTQFIKAFGWQPHELPDKNTWWQRAYPDETYQKFMIRQWELAVETYDPEEGNYMIMDAEIATKSNTSERYRVYTEVQNFMIPGHYLVMFSKLG